MIDVLQIAQILETEGVTITESNRPNRRDARVTDDESLPLPRCCAQTEEVTDEHAVRAGMGDEGDLLARVLDVPQGQLTLDPVDPTICEELRRTGMDSGHEVTNRLATLEAVPTIGGVAL